MRLAALMCAGSLAALGAAWQSSVEITYRLPKQIALGEPVVAVVVIDNRSDRQAQIDLGWNRVGAFSFTVTSSDGQTRTARPEIREGIAATPVVAVAARQQMEHWVVLDEWISLGPVANYAVSIDLAPSASRLLERPVTVPQGNRHLVTVVPRDAEALRRRCRELANLILPRTERSLDAARALSFVRDDVAIPFLREVISRDSAFGTIMIQGLGRIGTPNAIRELQLLTKSGLPELAAAAEFALARIKRDGKAR